MVLEPDGSIRIIWHADGFEAILVRARFRTRAELEAFARDVADVALLERTRGELAVALRRRYPGAFDLLTSEPQGGPWHVIVSFHPPKGEPNPDPR
jgi:hypothetical protein